MYRIAVCDDNPADAGYVTNFIEQWAAQRETAVHVEHFPSAEAFLFRYEEDKAFDILCLDIEMGAMSGMELAGKIREKALYLPVAGSMVWIPIGEIRYLEVQKNYVTIYGKETYTVKKTLGELEKALDESFFRTGRSFIVNLRYVKKITKAEVVLKDGTSVPLSRGLYESVNRAMIRYF